MCEPEFRGAGLLRLGPYSAPLNTIEEVWSVLKAELKRRLTVTMPALLDAAPEQCMALTEQIAPPRGSHRLVCPCRDAAAVHEHMQSCAAALRSLPCVIDGAVGTCKSTY